MKFPMPLLLKNKKSICSSLQRLEIQNSLIKSIENKVFFTWGKCYRVHYKKVSIDLIYDLIKASWISIWNKYIQGINLLNLGK